MNAIVRIRQFAVDFIRNERGDMSYADKTVHISSAAKVVIGAVAITGAAAGVTAVTNNSNSSSDKTSQQINQATGAQAEAAGKQKAPFANPTQ